jgi:hypothetical protein
MEIISGAVILMGYLVLVGIVLGCIYLGIKW